MRGSTAVIAGDRQSGKTRKIVDLVKADMYAILLVRNTMVAKDLVKKYPEIKDQVFSVASNNAGRFNQYHRIYFDDIDFMEQQFIDLYKGYEIGGMTMLAPGYIN